MAEKPGKKTLTRKAVETLNALVSVAVDDAQRNGKIMSDEVPLKVLGETPFYREDIAKALKSRSKDTLERVVSELLDTGWLDEKDEKSGRRGRPRKVYTLNLGWGGQKFRHMWRHYHEVLFADAVLKMLRRSRPFAVLVAGEAPYEHRIRHDTFGSLVLGYIFMHSLHTRYADFRQANQEREILNRKLLRGVRAAAETLGALSALNGFGQAYVILPYASARANPTIRSAIPTDERLVGAPTLPMRFGEIVLEIPTPKGPPAARGH